MLADKFIKNSQLEGAIEMAYFYDYKPEKDGHPDLFSLAYVDSDLFYFFLQQIEEEMVKILPSLTKGSRLMRVLPIGRMVYLDCRRKMGLQLSLQSVNLYTREAIVAVGFPFKGVAGDINAILQEIVDIGELSAKVKGTSLLFNVSLPEWHISEICHSPNGWGRRYYQCVK